MKLPFLEPVAAAVGGAPRRPRVFPLALLGAVMLCAVGLFFGLVHPVLAVALVVLLGAMAMALPERAPEPVAREPDPAAAQRAAEAAGDAKVRALVGALPEPALLLTPQGEIRSANERLALALGPARVGDPVSFVVRVPEILDAIRATAADGMTRRVEFAERVPLDRWLEAHVVPLHLAAVPHDGEKGRPAAPDGVLLTFRDLTQQRRIEKMRADFVANASHELRTPLASLSGFIETLQGPARNDAAARERFLAIMAAQARRMSRLIDDLLSLSRIELNAHVRPETEVELSSIVAHVCDTLSPLAKERGVELDVAGSETPLPVRGDRDELIRLFENLVENALKYAAGGKRVTVTLAREGGGDRPVALVRVRDYGPGIAPEHLPRLTERFYRVDVAASRDQGGTGLGLAIVKHIVARHRGRLSIESEPGAGATFSVRLEAVPYFDEIQYKSVS